MGLLDRLFGRRSSSNGGYQQDDPPHLEHGQPPAASDGRLTDDQAIARYRYLLKTAPPDQVEAAHAEAFAQLTPGQRQQVLTQLAAAIPPSERPRSDDPQTLARVATRAELRQPGTLERAFGGQGYGGPSFGSMVGGSLLGTIGGMVIGTAVADALFDTGLGDGGLFGGGDEEAYAQGYEDGAGTDSGDYGGDSSYADGGGDFGGGDFGGGDFGGGDFGGGDF